MIDLDSKYPNLIIYRDGKIIHIDSLDGQTICLSHSEMEEIKANAPDDIINHIYYEE